MRLLQHRVALLSVCLPMAIAVTACNQPPAAPPATPAPAASAAPASSGSSADRGKMLVIGGGCHDCHTPMKPGPNGAEPDMAKMLSGHPESITITAPMKPAGPWTVATNDTNTAWSGPWGVSFAANLTPDKETGLNMSERNFVIALKTGAHLGTARPILPPMPWPWYGQLGDEALKDIYAYLVTIPPLKNQVPAPIPPLGK